MIGAGGDRATTVFSIGPFVYYGHNATSTDTATDTMLQERADLEVLHPRSAVHEEVQEAVCRTLIMFLICWFKSETS